MVNPTTFPILRRGSSGPEADSTSPGTTVVPFDQLRYFDPESETTGDDGSIANPFLSWASMTAGIDSVGAWRVIVPGKPLVPGAEEIPLVGATQVVIQGNGGSDDGSYFSDTATVSENDDGAITFQDISIESLMLSGGSHRTTFRDAVVADLVVAGYDGPVYGFDTEFQIEQSTPDSIVKVSGGSILAWEALSFFLSDCVVGNPEAATAGALVITGDYCNCRCVTFGEGTTIEFSDAPGELWLDPSSYRSFLDSDVELTNGVVVRDDGSWPRASAEYTGGSVEIDWFANPRAIFNLDEAASVNFLAPLVREVQLIVIRGGEGGYLIDWNAPIHWTDGVEPDQDTTPGGVSVYRFDYEDGVYRGWCVGMDMKAP